MIPPAGDLVLEGHIPVVATSFVAFPSWMHGMNQTATYWPPKRTEPFGDLEVNSPELIRCRWQDTRAEFRNIPGEETRSNAIVYPARKLELGGFLALGDRTNEPDPMAVSGAYEIQKVGMSPSPEGDAQLNKVWL